MDSLNSHLMASQPSESNKTMFLECYRLANRFSTNAKDPNLQNCFVVNGLSETRFRRHSSAFRNILLSYDVFCELFNPINQSNHLVKDIVMPEKKFLYQLALHSAFLEGYLNRFDSEKFIAPNQCEIYEQVLLHMIVDIFQSESFKGSPVEFGHPKKCIFYCRIFYLRRTKKSIMALSNFHVFGVKIEGKGRKLKLSTVVFYLSAVIWVTRIFKSCL